MLRWSISVQSSGKMLRWSISVERTNVWIEHLSQAFKLPFAFSPHLLARDDSFSLGRFFNRFDLMGSACAVRGGRPPICAFSAAPFVGSLRGIHSVVFLLCFERFRPSLSPKRGVWMTSCIYRCKLHANDQSRVFDSALQIKVESLTPPS